jgi:hypothetical protein
MDAATLIESYATKSFPQYVIATYEYDMGTDSTAFISLSLPALYSAEPSYRESMRSQLTGKSYAIDLYNFNTSCDSTNFDIKVLSKGDESYVGTVYEVLTFLAINKFQTNAMERCIIVNEDAVMTNNLYLEIINHGSSVGNILIKLVYVTLQDR